MREANGLSRGISLPARPRGAPCRSASDPVRVRLGSDWKVVCANCRWEMEATAVGRVKQYRHTEPFLPIVEVEG